MALPHVPRRVSIRPPPPRPRAIFCVVQPDARMLLTAAWQAAAHFTVPPETLLRRENETRAWPLYLAPSLAHRSAYCDEGRKGRVRSRSRKGGREADRTYSLNRDGAAAEGLAAEAAEGVELEEDGAVGRGGEGSLDVGVDEGEVSGVELAADLAADHERPSERDADARRRQGKAWSDRAGDRRRRPKRRETHMLAPSLSRARARCKVRGQRREGREEPQRASSRRVTHPTKCEIWEMSGAVYEPVTEPLVEMPSSSPLTVRGGRRQGRVSSTGLGTAASSRQEDAQQTPPEDSVACTAAAKTRREARGRNSILREKGRGRRGKEKEGGGWGSRRKEGERPTDLYRPASGACTGRPLV